MTVTVIKEKIYAGVVQMTYVSGSLSQMTCVSVVEMLSLRCTLVRREAAINHA
jgi:hypothetical protein